jgi:thiol:disulfide interchange protein
MKMYSLIAYLFTILLIKTKSESKTNKSEIENLIDKRNKINSNVTISEVYIDKIDKENNLNTSNISIILNTSNISTTISNSNKTSENISEAIKINTSNISVISNSNKTSENISEAIKTDNKIEDSDNNIIQSSEKGFDENDYGTIPEEQSAEKYEESDIGTIPEEQSAEKFEESDIGTIPEEQSAEKYESSSQNNNYYKSEDEIAKKAFIVTLIILVAFIIGFIYNLIKCYSKSPSQTRRELEDNYYSRELQMTSTIQDDSVLDLAN